MSPGLRGQRYHGKFHVPCGPLTSHEPRDWSAGLRPGSILLPDTNAPERELSHCQAEVRLAAIRQATCLSRFSARANIRAAVWDKPRSDYTVGVCRFMGGIAPHFINIPDGG